MDNSYCFLTCKNSNLIDSVHYYFHLCKLERDSDRMLAVTLFLVIRIYIACECGKRGLRVSGANGDADLDESTWVTCFE